MPRYAVKKQEDKSRTTAIAIPAPQSNEQSTGTFLNKPTLQAYQEMADNSPRVRQQKTYQSVPPAVVQLHLADDLNSKKVNVAIAGERHGEVPDDEEQGAWGQAGITVHYEADSIPLNDGSGNEVTPDPLKLRLGFAYTALTEYTSPYLESSYQPGVSKDVPGAKDAREVLKYLLPVLISDLKRVPDSQAAKVEPVVAALTELRGVLRGNKLTKVVGDELARRSLTSKVRRNLELVGKFASDVHSKSAFKAVEFKSVPLRVARSQQMLERINNAAGSLTNTIYKVGNKHVEDMEQARWAPAPKVAVLERAKYLSDYQTLGSRGAPVVPSVSVPKSGGVPASVPVQSPAKLPVPVPKSGGVPASVPVQSPAKLPVASAPKPKPKPQPPPKSAADLKVEQMQVLFGRAPDKVKDAKGYLEIQAQLAHYNMRLSSEDIIRNIKQIIDERNERWAITKFLFRSEETQDLYDDLAAIIG
ncbi:MAG TPA: hypothetical protein VGE90_02280 [Chitinophaga sp.]